MAQIISAFDAFSNITNLSTVGASEDCIELETNLTYWESAASENNDVEYNEEPVAVIFEEDDMKLKQPKMLMLNWSKMMFKWSNMLMLKQSKISKLLGINFN